MRFAWGLGLGVLLAVTACTTEGGDDGKRPPSPRAEATHYWTAAPCSLFRGKTLLKGYTVFYALDIADPATQLDYGTSDGKQWPYQHAACTMHLSDHQQRIWDLDAAVDIYERTGPACSRHRVDKDLDAATASPDVIDDHAYRLSVGKGSRPGRTLQMCNGNARFIVTAQGPAGSRPADVQGTLDQLTDRGADVYESGLRNRHG
ncbi:hypothetical protein [Streptomyces sp. NPDC014805]|uniref:hypothetical protein n=1 Tax=Streptomyces sp. NPDC014805 TaxID=3364919 RepID=UPI0036FAA252